MFCMLNYEHHPTPTIQITAIVFIMDNPTIIIKGHSRGQRPGRQHYTTLINLQKLGKQARVKNRKCNKKL